MPDVSSIRALPVPVETPCAPLGACHSPVPTNWPEAKPLPGAIIR